MLDLEEELQELQDELERDGGGMDPDEEASFEDAAEYDEPSELRDAIADAMWDEYTAILAERDMDIEVD